MPKSQNQVQATKQAWPSQNACPEDGIPEDLLVAQPARAAQAHEWQLEHLHGQEVAPQLLEDAPHEQLVDARR